MCLFNMGIFRKLNLVIWEWKHPVSGSSHLKVYEELASEHSVPLKRVYRLAHGMRSESHIDERVVRDLIRLGIVVS